MLDPEYLRQLADGAESLAAEIHEAAIMQIVTQLMAWLERGDDYRLDDADGREEEKSLTSEAESSTVQSFESAEQDIQIGRSLGAKAFQDPVRLPNGKTAKIAEGTKITKVYTFAGPKAKNPVALHNGLQKYTMWTRIDGPTGVGTDMRTKMIRYDTPNCIGLSIRKSDA